MRIGIDISQLAYSGTGVANYLENFVAKLLEIDRENEYILFFSSLRNKFQISPALGGGNSKFSPSGDRQKNNERVKVRRFKFPPTLLDIIWNRLHILPIEMLIGPVDLFITSDWTEPPSKHAKKATILYDLIVYTYPEETATSIVAVQKRKLAWVKKESKVVFCISESTKKDAMDILGLENEKLKVLYPGVTL